MNFFLTVLVKNIQSHDVILINIVLQCLSIVLTICEIKNAKLMYIVYLQ